ncbi:MAG: pyridoxal-phosphate dependent enzyme [Polyangiaceae bacterium]
MAQARTFATYRQLQAPRRRGQADRARRGRATARRRHRFHGQPRACGDGCVDGHGRGRAGSTSRRTRTPARLRASAPLGPRSSWCTGSVARRRRGGARRRSGEWASLRLSVQRRGGRRRQGTLGLELVAPGGPAFDTVYVAVGGGGLVAGVAAAVAARPGVRVIGCLPENSPGMLASVRAGRIVEAPELPTLSDATAGGVEPGAITFDLCRALVDDWVTVTEEQIRAGFRALFDAERWIVEGAAAVAFAGLRAAAKPGERSVVVLCGRNASAAQIATLFG